MNPYDVSTGSQPVYFDNRKTAVQTAPSQVTGTITIGNTELEIKNDSGAPLGVSAVGALNAGENHLGSVGSDGKRIAAAPVLTPGTYTTGKCIGGLFTLPGLFRVIGKAATLQSASIHAKVNNAVAIDLVIFRAPLTGSQTGLVDNANFAVSAADFDKVSKVLNFTSWTSFGVPSSSRLDGIGAFLTADSSVDLQAILVSRGSVVIATASDLLVGLGVYQD